MRPTGEWLNQPGGLAERLYAMRKAAGLTQAAMAAGLGWSAPRISKLEHGGQWPSAADIEAWAAVCGQPGAVPGLLDMLATARAVHRQHRHQLRRGHAAMQQDVDQLVRRAKRIRGFEVALIPGLFQTPGYARCRALEVVRAYGAPAGGVEATVAAWMRRQEVLYEPGRTFEFVIAEAALRFRLGPPDVMAGQLDRLLALSELASVTLGIIPFAAELPVTPLHGFLMADDVTYVETFASDIVLRGEESSAYERIFDMLSAEAVTGDDARRLLRNATTRLTED